MTSRGGKRPPLSTRSLLLETLVSSFREQLDEFGQVIRSELRRSEVGLIAGHDSFGSRSTAGLREIHSLSFMLPSRRFAHGMVICNV